MGSPTAPSNPKFLLDDPKITAAINSVTMRTKFPNTAIGRQLEQAAKLIQLGPQLGVGQQIISCIHGGYDTHFAQATPQQAVFTQLGQAIGAFNRAIQENRAFNRVTLFTQTEFNRTLAANSNGGSEHGWGGHNFVFGGSVLGGEMFGEFPRLALGGDDDAAGDGRFIPTTSLDQFGGTIVNWLGGNPVTALPQLANFTNKTLGFLTA